jgi:membrane protein implicated in regulation of membrane protease activity
MEFFNLNTVEILILIGFVSIILEFFVLSGIGVLFLGFGAFSAAGLLYLKPEMFDYTYFLLGLLSVFWAILLWKPLKNWNHKTTEPRNIDIIGSKVQIIESDIEPGIMGKVKWSGTIMNAKLSNKVTSKISSGSYCKVVEVKGNVLILEPINL